MVGMITGDDGATAALPPRLDRPRRSARGGLNSSRSGSVWCVGAGYSMGYRQATGIACVSDRTASGPLRGLPVPEPNTGRHHAARSGSCPRLARPRTRTRRYALTFGQWGNKNVRPHPRRPGPLLQHHGERSPWCWSACPTGRDAVEARVAALGLSDLVTIRPWLSRADFQRCFSSAALVVFPSDHEGFGLPAVEAMRLGIPLVVTPDKALLETTGGLTTVTSDWTAASLARPSPRRCSRRPKNSSGVWSTQRRSPGSAWPASFAPSSRTVWRKAQPDRKPGTRSAAAGEHDESHPQRGRQDALDGSDSPAQGRPGLAVLLQTGPSGQRPVELGGEERL